MAHTRRTLASALLGLAGLVPAAAFAQADAGADDLIRRVRGAPGSRIGGATRGIRQDDTAQGNAAAPRPAAAPAVPTAPRTATTGG